MQYTLPVCALMFIVSAAFTIGGIAFYDYVENKSKDQDTCAINKRQNVVKGFIDATDVPWLTEATIGANTILRIKPKSTVYIENIVNEGIILAAKDTMYTKAFNKDKFSFDTQMYSAGRTTTPPRPQFSRAGSDMITGEISSGRINFIHNSIFKTLKISPGGALIVPKSSLVLIGSNMTWNGKCGLLTPDSETLLEQISKFDYWSTAP